MDSPAGQDPKPGTGTEPGSDDTGNTTPKELLEVLEKAGMKKALDEYVLAEKNKEADRRVTQALKTQAEKLQTEQREAEAKRAKEEKEKTMSEPEKRLQELNEKIEKLTGTLTGLSEAQKKKDRESLVKVHLEKEGLPDTFARFVNVDDEAKIPDEIKTIKKEFLDLKQKQIDEKMKGNKPSRSQAGDRAVVDSAVEAYIKNQSSKGGIPPPGFEKPKE